MLSARGAAASSAREGLSRPRTALSASPISAGLPRRPRLPRGSDSRVPLQLVGAGWELRGIWGGGDRGGEGAGLPAGQGLRLSQVFQEGRRWFQGGARNPRGLRVYTDPELTSGLCLQYARGQARDKG